MAGQVLLGWPSFLTSEPFLRGRKRIDGWRQPNTVIVNPLLALSSHDYICAMARILLIDDDPALLMDLLALIEQVAPAIAADTAPTAEQALRLIQWTEYNAIVSDFNMHGLRHFKGLQQLVTFSSASIQRRFSGQSIPLSRMRSCWPLCITSMVSPSMTPTTLPVKDQAGD